MKILVTGGTGFIGKALVHEFVRLRHTVTSFALDTAPELDRLGVRQLRGDLADAGALAGAAAGQAAVFHTAARTGTAGRYRDFHTPNVRGTEHVLAACARADVRYLVYTGSPSAVFRHRPIEGLAENECAYPEKFMSYYEETKARAEQLVVSAGKRPGSTLKTVVVRPHLVYGPGDTNLLPRLEARARSRSLIQVGEGTNLVSLTHIANAVRGHVRALEALVGDAGLSGNCYFITDGPPVNLWDWIRGYLERKGLPGPVKKYSYKTAYRLGAAFEILWKLPGIRRREPPLTRFTADQFAMSHYYSIDKAKNDLGYKPGEYPCC